MVQEYGTYKEPGFREAGSPFVTTVFIALATVFVAMTTVFIAMKSDFVYDEFGTSRR